MNVGIVLATESSYLIPTIFDADGKSSYELSDEIERLRTDATAGRLSAQAFAGATFSLWNAGELGLDGASILVVAPQAAALAAGASALTLSCDHRILYGVRAAAFLGAIRSRLARSAG